MILSLLLSLAATGRGAITFTGDAAADFTNSGAFVVEVADDTFLDVGLPPGWPFPESGWDMKSLFFSYDGATDTLSLGIDCFAVCGDADGNGDPNGSSPELVARGGQDLPGYANSESFAVAFDIGVEGSNSPALDGKMDFILGFPAEVPGDSERFPCGDALDESCFGLYRFDQDNTAAQPGQRFFVRATDSVLPHPVTRFQIPAGQPISASNSDLEFTVEGFNELRAKFGVPPVDARAEWSINVLAFAGSFQDDGVGEDSFPNDAEFREIVIPCSLNDACDICGGDGSTCLDCAGIPNGPNDYDACDVCGGDDSTCRDCNGVPNGPDVYDSCDVCGGDSSSCRDCLNQPGGTATYDECDVCAGDSTTCLDCLGVPNGANTYDLCDVCAGTSGTCLDCAGIPNGPNEYDVCDVCGGDSTTCLDCAGQPGGNARYDACDVCGGNNTSCLDCNGAPNGPAVYDECDVCEGDGSSCCGGDGKECCVNYCGVPDSYWDFILLPVTLDDIIAKLHFTNEILQWLCDALPPYEEIGPASRDMHFGRMAEFNRIWLEDCLEDYCEAAATMYSQLVADNANPDCPVEH